MGPQGKFTYQSTAEMAADSLTKRLGASRLPQMVLLVAFNAYS